MKVLIVGSRRHLAPTATEENQAFDLACEQLGERLAARGHTLVVGTDDPLDADPHFVAGVAKDPRRHIVVVSRPDADTRPAPFEAIRATHLPRIEFKRVRHRGVWTSIHANTLGDADILLVIGGKGTTLSIGYVAGVLRKPVLAIPCFGGAACNLWDVVTNYYDKSGITDELRGELSDPWTDKTAQLAVRCAEALVKRPPFARDGIAAEVAIFVAVLLLLVAWVMLYKEPLFLGTDRGFFVPMLIAALLGTILRSGIRLLKDASARLDARLLLREAINGLLVSFGLMLFYFVGGFVINGKQIPLDKPDDYIRVAISMSILGFASAMLMETAIASLTDRLAKTFAPDKPHASER